MLLTRLRTPPSILEPMQPTLVRMRRSSWTPPSDAVADASVPFEADAPTESAVAPDDAAAEADQSAVADAVDPGEAEAAVSCGAGTKRCGNSCVNITDPATGCAAASCAPCALPRASSTCGATGECAVLGCAAGYDDCDTLAANGCEAVLSSDVSNCGACGRACAADNVLSKQCAGGLCVSTCSAGHGNCSYPYSAADDGCESRGRQHALRQLQQRLHEAGQRIHVRGSGSQPVRLRRRQRLSRHGVDGNVRRAQRPMRLRCDGGAGEACKKISGPTPDVCSCNGGNACSASQTCCQSPAG